MEQSIWSLENLTSDWDKLANPIALPYDADARGFILKLRVYLPVLPNELYDVIVVHEYPFPGDCDCVRIGFSMPFLNAVLVFDLPNGDVRIRWRGTGTKGIYDELHAVAETRHIGEIQLKYSPLVYFFLESTNLKPELWDPMGLLNVHQAWWRILGVEFAKPYFKKLCEFVVNERMAAHSLPVYPCPFYTFAWTRSLAPSQVKVVIVGQNPYHNEGKATGLAFSLHLPNFASRSLKEIFLALDEDGMNFDRLHGDLASWAHQGVLLLNNVMTVRKGDPKSHRLVGWERFTNAIIEYVCRKSPCVVFFLWGNETWDKADIIEKHNVKYQTRCCGSIARFLILCSHDPISTAPCSCPKKHFVRDSDGKMLLRHEFPVQECSCPQQHLEPDWTIGSSLCDNFRYGQHFSTANKFFHVFGHGAIDWNLPWKDCP